MDDRFFTYLERSQVEGAIDGQVLRGCLIESHVPILKCAQLQEAARYLLTCSWRTHRVTQYNRDIARQSIVHQAFTIRSQEMQVLRSQAKERERMTTIAADQFCPCLTRLGQLVLLRGQPPAHAHRAQQKKHACEERGS